MALGIYYSPRFLDHDTGPGHPERPERLAAIVEHLQQANYSSRLELRVPQVFDPDLPAIAHDQAYVKRVLLTCNRGDQHIDTFDNAICVDSGNIAILAANATAQGIDAVLGDENRALVLPRPPGHHAEFDQALGFCLFNNVAIAARYAQQKYSVGKIAIIDFDVHHGNGTQHYFENDDSVLYISTHRYPFFPGTGTADETGRGAGAGATVNYPLAFGTGNDIYLDIYRNAIPDIILKFRPELILLSTGFDAHEMDPLGGMQLTTAAFSEISQILVQTARECCQGKVLSVLEGGYSIEGSRQGMEVHIQELLED